VTMSLPEFYVAGARIHAIRVADAVSTIADWVSSGRRDYIVLTGAHGVVEMQTDPTLLEINNRAGLSTPDGMPVVWLGRLKGQRNIEKVYAPDIMAETFRLGRAAGYRHFLYGGQPGVCEQLRDRLRERYPGLDIVGTYCPPFRPLEPHEREEVSRLINDANPQIVWVGLGCPKQDYWMHEFRPRLRAPVLIGVGAGFDFLSGRMPLAPRWIQHSGFEWLFRTVSDPARLGRRYARVVPLFVYYVLRDSLRAGRRARGAGAGG